MGILDTITAAYIECIYFTDTGDSEQPSTGIELAADAREACRADCERFMEAAGGLLTEALNREGYDAIRAGHDFWYTRNGHGVGFWCRDELEAGELGDKLSEVCKQFPAVDAYEGDDGLLYIS